MQRRSFFYEVRGHITLSHAELGHLANQAAAHYDTYCQSAALVGGFIYGWCVRAMSQAKVAKLYGQQPDEVVKVVATPHELDICMKILETPGSDAKLAAQLRSCFSECAAEWERLTKNGVDENVRELLQRVSLAKAILGEGLRGSELMYPAIAEAMAALTGENEP